MGKPTKCIEPGCEWWTERGTFYCAQHVHSFGADGECRHRSKYAGREAILAHYPAFYKTHPGLPAGWEWQCCANSQCDWAEPVCFAADGEFGENTPLTLDGEEWYTMPQAIRVLGWEWQHRYTNRLAKLLREGDLPGRKWGKGIWLVKAGAVVEYAATQPPSNRRIRKVVVDL